MHDSLTGPRVILTSPEELRALVAEAVRAALGEHKADAPSEWLDTSAAAELLGVNVRTLMKHAAAGAIPASRLGRLWRFRRVDLERYLRGVPPSPRPRAGDE